MLQHRDPPHPLGALKSTTTPRRLLFLDCAATSRKANGVYVKSWLTGALGKTHYTSRAKKRCDESSAHNTPVGLWGEVDGFCNPNRRVVLWAYDLALQLRVSQGLVHLPRLGWALDRIVLERSAAWASFKHGKRSLLMCDLKSWAPVDFNRFANEVMDRDLLSPDLKAGPDLKANTCLWRVGVIRDAVLQMLDWIEGENLGPFRPTGSGQSYAAYRRRFLTDTLIVHDNERLLAAERTAMWTGRCEAWKHGTLKQGPYVEYDMQTAYCVIARDCELPASVRAHHHMVGEPTLRKMMDKHAVLAKVEIETQVPCVPTMIGTRTAWPVGTFRTWLWDPELKLALDHADKVRVLEAYTYNRAPALQDFASWVLGGMGGQAQVYGQVPKLVLKHWSRCLVGRLGLRYRAWEKVARLDYPDLRLTTVVDEAGETATDMLIAGFDWLLLTDMQEATESLPQIPSWVMSECRRRVWEAMSYMGFGSVIYVDTDSIIGHAGSFVGDWTGKLDHTLGPWAIKGRYNRMTIHGPRNLMVEDVRKVAGLPKTARQVAPLEFSGTVMRSIKESMRAGELDRVTELPRRFILDAPDLRRKHLPNGDTEPFRVAIQPNQED